MNTDNYFHIALSCSVVPIFFDGEKLMTVIQYKEDNPFKGAPMAPSTMVDQNQNVEEVAELILSDIFTNNTGHQIEQLKAFSKLFRHPNGRIVNVAQYAVLDFDENRKLSSNTKYKIVEFEKVPALILDHDEIIEFAKERLKRRVKRRPIGFHLLAEEFTFREIHELYEQSLRKCLDKRNFRKKLFNSQLLIDTGKTIKIGNNNKPSHLYKFNQKEYETLTLKGYDFSFF